MPQVHERINVLGDIRYGLNTRDRRAKLHEGEAVKTDACWLYNGLAPWWGYERAISRRPFMSPPMLDGFRQGWMIRVPTTGTALSFKADAAPYTNSGGVLDIVTQTSSITARQYVLFKTPIGGTTPDALSTSNCDYALTIDRATTSGKLRPVWTWRRSSGATIEVLNGPDVMVPGTAYRVAVQVNTSSRVVTINVYSINLTDPSSPIVALAGTASSAAYGVAGDAVPVDRAGFLFVGTWMRQLADRPVTKFASGVRGKIQDLRFWNTNDYSTLASARATEVAAATANLLSNYRFSEKQTIRWPDTKAVGADAELQFRDAEWRSGGRMRFDGVSNRLRIPSPFQYRRPDTDTDGKLLALDKPCVLWKGQVLGLTNGETIAHSVHAARANISADAGLPANNPPGAPSNATNIPFLGASSAFTGAPEPPSDAQWQLQVVETPGSPGVWQFRMVWWWYDTGASKRVAYSLPSTLGGAGVAINTTYVVAAWRNASSGLMTLHVVSAGGVNTATATAGAGFKPNATDNDPPGSTKAYGMFLSAPVSTVRKGNANPFDPDDLDVRFNFVSQGATSSCAAYVDVDTFALLDGDASQYVAQYAYDNDFTSLTARSIGATLLSAYTFTEGSGPSVEDFGVIGNDLTLEDDADFLRGRSMIQTLSRGSMHGLAEHVYLGTTSQGIVRKFLAFYDGGVDEIDETNNRLNFFAEGLRNDGDRIVSCVRHQNSLIITTGSGPVMRLYRDNLWRLGIKRPEGPFSWGLVNQGEREAAKSKGRLVYYWTHYNSDLDIDSPASDPIVVEIEAEGADVGFGLNVKSFQTAPASPWGTGKAPWDWEDKKNVIIVAAHWLDNVEDDPAGAGTNKAKYYKAKFTTKGGVKTGSVKGDIDAVKAEDVQDLCFEFLKRLNVELDLEGKIRFVGKFLGPDAKLYVGNQPGGGYNIMGDFGIPNTTHHVAATPFAGTDATSDIPIPPSFDPQVTHRRLWCTLSDGDEARLVLEVPVGQDGPVYDRVSDEDNTDKSLDIEQQNPPRNLRFVTTQFGRLILWGDPLEPSAYYFSEFEQPHAFLPTATNIVTDGQKLEILGIGRTENQLIVFKRNLIEVISEPRNPSLPFTSEPRSYDVGGVSPYGILNSGLTIVWPAVRHFYVWDGSGADPISRVIKPTWDAVPPVHRQLVAGAHFQPQEMMAWTTPTGQTLVNGAVVCDQLIGHFYEVPTPDGQPRGWTVAPYSYLRALFVIPSTSDVDELWGIDHFGFPYRFAKTVYDFGLGAHQPSLTRSGTFAGAQALGAVTLPAAPSGMPEGRIGLGVTIQQTTAHGGARATRLIVTDAAGLCALDHNLPFLPTTGDTWTMCSIENEWQSGDHDIGGRGGMAKVTGVHIENTAQTTVGSIEVGYTPLEAMAVVADEQVDTFGNNVADVDIPSFEGDARYHRLRIAAKGTNKPYEIGHIAYTVIATGRGETRAKS